VDRIPSKGLPPFFTFLLESSALPPVRKNIPEGRNGGKTAKNEVFGNWIV
jgi:hypothetical protein